MTSKSTSWEIFISYSRRDNAKGWVTALHDQILADHRNFSTEPLRIFFDTEIRTMDDWRHRILGALRQSKILLVCLSENYLGTDQDRQESKRNYCLWEWEEYVRRQVHQLMGSDSIATIYFTEVPGSNEYANATWLNSVRRSIYTDIRDWFPLGAKAIQQEKVRTRMAKLGESLWERVERARRASDVPGNLRRKNQSFVGRAEELRDLHEHLATGAIGVVTVIHGVGGQGKTELAVAYAHSNADLFPVGLWVLGAEGKKELLPLIAELADAPEFGYRPTDAEKKEPVLLGRAVLEELRRRASAARERDPGGRAAVLLLLDNVSEPALLALTQLTTLPRADWLRIVATTRLGPDQLRVSDKSLGFVAVDSLPEEDSLALMREHQSGQQFCPDAEEAAAREIVRELDGFTLAVEQVAVLLGLHPEISPSNYLSGLRRKGLLSTVDLLGKSEDIQARLHQKKQFTVILQDTLALLDVPAKTALEFAALLPPDSIPWPWLKGLVTEIYPELATFDSDEPDPWMNTRRRLEGQRLLTPTGDNPEVARLHRMVGAYLVAQLKTEGRHAQLLKPLMETLRIGAECCHDIAMRDLHRHWTLDAIGQTVLHLSRETLGADAEFAYIADLTGNAELFLGRFHRADELLFLALTHRRELFEANRRSIDAIRNYVASAIGYGSFCLSFGDVDQARAHIEDAIEGLALLQAMDVSSVDLLGQTGLALVKLGLSWFSTKRSPNPELASRYLEKAGTIAGRLFKEHHHSDKAVIYVYEISRHEMHNYVQLHQFLIKEGKVGLAGEYLKKAQLPFDRLLECQKPLARAGGDSDLIKADRALQLNAVFGDYYLALGEVERAIELFHSATRIAETFLTHCDSTLNSIRLHDSLIRLQRSYLVRAQSGDAEESKKYADRAAEIQRGLREKESDAHPR